MSRTRSRHPGAFVHGFTYSHHPVGAAVAGEVLRILVEEDLVAASAAKGDRLRALLARPARVASQRGRDPRPGTCSRAWSWSRTARSRLPFPRASRVTESVVAAARDAGVLLYSGTGNANGTDGDQILLGPPFVVTDDELERIVDVLGTAIETPCGASALTAERASATPTALGRARCIRVDASPAGIGVGVTASGPTVRPALAAVPESPDG